MQENPKRKRVKYQLRSNLLISLLYLLPISSVFSQSKDLILNIKKDEFLDSIIKPFADTTSYYVDSTSYNGIEFVGNEINKPILEDYVVFHSFYKKNEKSIEIGLTVDGVFRSFNLIEDDLTKYYNYFYSNGLPNKIWYTSDTKNFVVVYYPNGELRYKRIGDNVDDTLIVRKYPNGILREKISYKITPLVSKDTNSFNEFKYVYISNDSLVPQNKFDEFDLLYDRFLLKYRILDGYHEFRYPNNKIKQIGWYKNNKKDGVWLFFNENGKLIRKQTFKNDISKACEPCGKIEKFICLSNYSFHKNKLNSELMPKFKPKW